MQELTSAGKTLPLSKSLAYGAALCVAAMAGMHPGFGTRNRIYHHVNLVLFCSVRSQTLWLSREHGKAWVGTERPWCGPNTTQPMK